MAVDAEALQVGQLAPQALEVAAVVIALLVGQVAVRQHVLLRVAGHAGPPSHRSCSCVAVVEPVGHGEVEDLVDERVAHGLAHEGGVVDRHRRRHRDVEDVADLVVAERDDVPGALDRERDVGTVTHAASAVVLVPCLVDRHLRLVGARRQG